MTGDFSSNKTLLAFDFTANLYHPAILFTITGQKHVAMCPQSSHGLVQLIPRSNGKSMYQECITYKHGMNQRVLP